MVKKKPKEIKSFTAHGISFPIAPLNLLAWSKNRAKEQGKNLSGYIIDLIIQDKRKAESRNNG